MNEAVTSAAVIRSELRQAEMQLHRLLETRNHVQPAERELVSRRIQELENDIAALQAELACSYHSR